MKRKILLLWISAVFICSATFSQTTIWSTNFESLAGISAFDLDADGYNWFQNSDGTLMGFAPGKYMGSYSFNTSPDNVITCPVFNIPAAASNMTFSLRVASSSSSDYAESFAVYIQEDGVGSMFDNEIYNGTLNSGGPGTAQLVNGSISNSFAGKDVRLIVRHFNTTNQLLFMIDDLLVESGQALSLEDSEFSSFSIYPNPTTDELNFRTSVTVSAAQIYNLLGQNVMSYDSNMLSDNKIDVSNLQTGNYLIRVTINSDSQIFRFIKN
ncbi:MAG: T9SS type A sorting domain-containing protein [Flavobacteriaceae bacterium]|nr:T9SS type A sorting domain-containing protein [Bacteroidia bacterium]NNF74166.1 T9SS type A sorting domain-containing protein [Flavobacteriaceae bacterium]NNK73124.1 T9SS type A sorting domain-containing protein [Flavobacteriaceae bacterium]